MAYSFFEHSGDVGVTLTGASREELFVSAALAFTDSITPLSGVEPRRPEEVAMDAPDLELLLVDFLSELLYRFDTRGWLTRGAEIDVRERDGGFALEGTLSGEKLDPARHPIAIEMKAVVYPRLHVVEQDGLWRASVVFDV